MTEHAGEGDGIQAYLTPLGARRLLGMPMRGLTGEVVELADVIGHGAADALAERLAVAPGWPARFALLERAIAARVLDAPPVSPGLDWAWRRLVGPTGPCRSARSRTSWAGAAGTSRCVPRGARAAAEAAGAAAAVRARRRPAARPAPTWPTPALDSGYYDQAHFNRDFRRSRA